MKYAWAYLLTISAIVALALTCRTAQAEPMINVPEEQLSTFERLLSDKCDLLQETVDADYCAYQYTDVQIDGPDLQARVQFTVGCFSDEPVMQEMEAIIRIQFEPRLRWLGIERIDSAHLPDGGVQAFWPMTCNTEAL